MATSTDPGSNYSRGFCTHFVQLGVLCALEVVAGSCLWWARSEDFAILHQPKGRVLTWNKELVAKGDKAQTQKLLSKLEKPRVYMSWAILIVAGCYLGGSALYTFSVARAHHRKATAGTNTEKLSDSWLVKVALVLYIVSACPALVLSAWLGYGVYFSPKAALNTFNFGLSFEQSRTGVQLFTASATITLVVLAWRLVALCHDFYKYSQKKAAQPDDMY